MFSDGAVYVGDFRGEKKEGNGVETFPDGRVFKGEWKNDILNGKATAIMLTDTAMRANSGMPSSTDRA